MNPQKAAKNVLAANEGFNNLIESKMSSLDSNLSSLGYDLVVGLTQNSMNATMKRYLSTMDTPIPAAYYVYTDDSLTSVQLISYDQLMALTGGVDPFAIPDGTSSTTTDPSLKAAGQALFDAYFAFAFQATMGLPSTHAPDIITLQDGNSSQRVWYEMYFKSFQIVQQTDGRSSWTYSNQSQDPNNPWVYQWEVGLDLQSADFESLPTATQNSIKNLNSASMFSVQQLMLDLNSAPTYSAEQPVINTNFDASPLLQQYLSGYWDALRALGGAVFAQAIQPINSQPNPATPTLIPTDLDFIVSPYIPNSADGTLSPSQQNGLYCLNYLVMADGHAFPNTIAAPAWNWLSAAEDNSYDGVMAVRKGEFVNYLKQVLSPALADICIQPTVDMEAEGLKVHYHWNHQPANPMPTYQTVNNSSDPTHVLTVSYTSDQSEDKSNPGYDIIAVQGDTLIWSSVQSDVYISGKTITCTTLTTAYLDVGLAGVGGHDMSHTRGYMYATLNTTVFTLGVTTAGALQVAMTKSNQNLCQTTNSSGAYYSGDLNASFFAQFLTVGGMQDMVDSINSYYVNLMTNYMSNFNEDVCDLLNNLNAWVFPGAETFIYSNCQFSNALDLTTIIKYADVS